MNDPNQNTQSSGLTLEPQQLRDFFISHLNRIYCAKAHLVERLPELADQAQFRDLRYAIIETMEDIDRQIARMDEVFVLLDEKPSIEKHDELIDFLENGFAANYQQVDDLVLRDLSILFYLSLVESIEVASFHILLMAADKMHSKQIKQLLQENFDESKADRSLFTQITAKYIN
ncbi:DUF892 family protein [Mucilaginibacter jinjuensis]|uniref:DUF892 family protein n=1 Tax=Mucilaginibacter jinjuensis TaxID=1176721 RepID=A0ABY7TFN1_9SPHI|nr:DUF892 family protein [Mucilaginibacter jinjuensis]WCT14886.1 DUF892 family protein [Mucilaginibacter jinjuensis]